MTRTTAQEASHTGPVGLVRAVFSSILDVFDHAGWRTYLFLAVLDVVSIFFVLFLRMVRDSYEQQFRRSRTNYENAVDQFARPEIMERYDLKEFRVLFDRDGVTAPDRHIRIRTNGKGSYVEIAKDIDRIASEHEEMSRGCVLEFDHDAPDRGVTIMIPVDRSCDEWSTDSFWAPRDRKEGGS